MAKTLTNVALSNLSLTDKKCIEEVFKKFEVLTSADVVEVVRCKGCKLRKTNDCAMYYECDCGGQFDWENDNDFCSYGQRK